MSDLPGSRGMDGDPWSPELQGDEELDVMSDLHKCPQCGCPILVLQEGQISTDDELNVVYSHQLEDKIKGLNRIMNAHNSRITAMEDHLNVPDKLRSEFIAIRDHLVVPTSKKANDLEERVERLEQRRKLSDERFEKLIEAIKFRRT